jgi:tripartite-type tricarboxylate transporter receptor subunit TctC
VLVRALRFDVRLICIALFAASALLVLSSAFSHPAAAQEWPIRTVKVIVPYTPGGATDTMARVVADRASKILGQPFIIDNRPGAGGAIGTEAAVRAPKDGYTFYVASATQVAVLPLMQKLSYDPRKDLTPLSIVGENPMGLAVTPRLAVRSVRELIDYALANPGKLNYAIGGFGTSSHLMPAAFAAREGINMVPIPYKGGTAALTAVLTGEADLYFGNMSDSVEQAKAGNVRLLAISSGKRKAEFPDIPTISETNPGFSLGSWNGLFAPTGTPSDIVDRMAKLVAEICHEPETVEKLARLGIDPIGSTPEEMARAIANDIPNYAAAVEATGLRLRE